jgi:hypothetical protein
MNSTQTQGLSLANELRNDSKIHENVEFKTQYNYMVKSIRTNWLHDKKMAFVYDMPFSPLSPAVKNQLEIDGFIISLAGPHQWCIRLRTTSEMCRGTEI